MRQIWRFPLVKQDNADFVVDMPIGSKILCVQMKKNEANIWAEVETEEDKEKRYFRIFGTGHDIPYDFKGKYIGTFQINAGGVFGIFVWHLYEMEK